MVYENPLEFFSGSHNFNFTPPEVAESLAKHAAAKAAAGDSGKQQP